MAGPARQTAPKTRVETEVKIASGDLDRLRTAGFQLSLVKPRHFEDNWLLDSPDHTLFSQGAALRVRIVDGRGLVTFKGKVKESNGSLLKVREEIESETTEPYRIIEVFEHLGYQRAFRYQKYRTLYSMIVGDLNLEVAFDQTPMGDFIEIEGDEASVLRVLDLAGFTKDDVTLESYPELQASRCKAEQKPIEDLTFSF